MRDIRVSAMISLVVVALPSVVFSDGLRQQETSEVTLAKGECVTSDDRGDEESGVEQSFTIWNSLEVPVAIETLHWRCQKNCCSRTYVAVCAAAKFEATSMPSCCVAGRGYGLKVTLKTPGGPLVYYSKNNATCYEDSQEDYYLFLDSKGDLYVKDGKGPC